MERGIYDSTCPYCRGRAVVFVRPCGFAEPVGKRRKDPYAGCRLVGGCQECVRRCGCRGGQKPPEPVCEQDFLPGDEFSRHIADVLKIKISEGRRLRR